jgi:hypothetical protein
MKSISLVLMLLFAPLLIGQDKPPAFEGTVQSVKGNEVTFRVENCECSQLLAKLKQKRLPCKNASPKVCMVTVNVESHSAPGTVTAK